jgi:hypothetical protein
MQITTVTAAAVLGIEYKAIDNILCRDAKHLIKGGRQGRLRRIDAAALTPIAIAIVLQRELGVPLARGVEIGEQLTQDRTARIAVGRLGALTLDVAALQAHLSTVLAEVLEQTTPPKRGRPPRSANRAR